MSNEEKKVITENDLEHFNESTGSIQKLTSMTLEELRERQQNGFRKKKDEKPPEPPTAEQLAYIKKVNDAAKSDSNFSLESLMKTALGPYKPKEVIPYPVSVEDCTKLFYSILETLVAKQDRKFVLEEVNKPKIAELVKYFAGYPCKLNLNKGIYLFGPVGRGKTFILHALMIMCNTIEGKLEAANVKYTARKFSMKNAKSIATELAESKKPEVIKQYYSKVWCFDDLGIEDKQNIWGNTIDVIGDIIIERYQKFQQGGLITHATSNIQSEKWKDKYGDRVESRMIEMFNPIKLEGEDKRKL